ncbi:MAG: dihydroorotase [Bacteroidales bacterium]
MPDKPYLLKNVTIVNEGRSFHGALLLQNGIIEKIFEEEQQEAYPEDRAQVIDLNGMTVIPGVIDDQVHFREPGLTHKADIRSESRAAVAGGITTFMEMPNTKPATVTQALLEEKFRLAQDHSLANYSFYMGATNDNHDELLATDPGHCCGIKVFMGSSTGNMLVDNPDTLAAIFRETRLPVAVHAEDEQIIRSNITAAKAAWGEAIPIHMHPVIRSHEACERSTRQAISLAEKYDTRLHLLHLSTLDEMRMLDNETPLAEKRITAEACVHHLWFSIDDYARKGSYIKWNPAVKYKTDQQALISAVKDGRIDVLATDHAPHTSEEKNKPYTECPSGGPMVQHALPAMITLANKQHITLEQLVSLMCHQPAICFNINNRGFIREGYAADLVVIDTTQNTIVNKENILYKCGWSPLENTSLDASVTHTFINGNLVYEKGSFYENVRGEAISFSR